MGRNNMGLGTIAIVALAVGIGLWGFNKYMNAEDNTFKSVKETVQTLASQLGAAETEIKELKGLKLKVADLEEKLQKVTNNYADVESELEKAQDHLAKTREQMIELREKLAQKSPSLQLPSTINLNMKTTAKSSLSAEEVALVRKHRADQAKVKPPKEMLMKVKKQVEELSK